MSLADIKLNSTAKRGFTIVELLIVVVVIAILAAITIVSYNGITTKANASAAKSIAATWQKKVELYQAEEGRYPINAAELSANSAKSWHITNASLTPSGGATTAENGKTRVQVVACGDATPAAGNVSGVRITFFDYEASTPAPTANPIVLGTCGTPGTNGSTAWAGPAL